KPRGIDNKLRISLRSAGFLPKIGFRTAVSERGMHPSGMQEVRISTEGDLKKLDSKIKIAVRLSAGLGKKARGFLTQAAEKLGFKVLNPEKKKKVEAKKAETKAEAKTEVKKEMKTEEKKVEVK
ncbi:MAG: eL32 family ribosomal protein, partial [Candidatus Micrarchaeota archaeon]